MVEFVSNLIVFGLIACGGAYVLRWLIAEVFGALSGAVPKEESKPGPPAADEDWLDTGAQ